MTTDAGWVLLTYRIPREPSTPRIAVWRRLRQLGVAQVGDGLVALPARPETLEALEWVAEQVIEANGDAVVWKAAPTLRRDQEQLISQLSDARRDEYNALLAEISEAGRTLGNSVVDKRTLSRWRREYRRIEARDYFNNEQRDAVRLALTDLATGEQLKAEVTK